MVLAATESEAGQLAAAIEEWIKDAGTTIIYIQHGKALRNQPGKGIEHFGYVDGRSQPLMLVEDIENEAMTGGTARWDPAFPLAAALVKDPGVADPDAFGSLFVFRKLEQHVRAFKTRATGRGYPGPAGQRRPGARRRLHRRTVRGWNTDHPVRPRPQPRTAE